jgi:hypothetical protein
MQGGCYPPAPDPDEHNNAQNPFGVKSDVPSSIIPEGVVPDLAGFVAYQSDSGVNVQWITNSAAAVDFELHRIDSGGIGSKALIASGGVQHSELMGTEDLAATSASQYLLSIKDEFGRVMHFGPIQPKMVLSDAAEAALASLNGEKDQDDQEPPPTKHAFFDPLWYGVALIGLIVFRAREKGSMQ